MISNEQIVQIYDNRIAAVKAYYDAKIVLAQKQEELEQAKTDLWIEGTISGSNASERAASESDQLNAPQRM
jgi:hypothetical protein